MTTQVKAVVLALCAVFGSSLALADDSGGKPYYFPLMSIPEAHRITRGSPSVKVAVLSTGINYRLPELSDAIDVLPFGTGMYDGDVYGADIVHGTGNPMDNPSLSLGTAEAGLIASKSYGVAPGVKIFPVRICSENGVTNNSVITQGIQYAINRGARIIAIDVGGARDTNTHPSEGYCAAIQMAAAHGVLVVGAAGNEGEGGESDRVPGGCDASNLVIATSLNRQGGLASFANWDLLRVMTAAPGEGVPTLSFNGDLTRSSGGSFAAALTAGTAALVLSAHPGYSPRETKEALLRGVDADPNLADKVASRGRLNAWKALTVKIN